VAPAVLITPPPETAPGPIGKQLSSAPPAPSIAEGAAARGHDPSHDPSTDTAAPTAAVRGPIAVAPPTAVDPPKTAPPAFVAKTSATGAPQRQLQPALPSSPTGVETEANPYIAQPETARRAGASSSACMLHLNATPAATVLLDGKLLGQTPKTSVSIAPGEHRVHFRWQGGEKREAFTCGRGETKNIAVRQEDSNSTDESFIKNPYR
jgi:hypothetical protein